ncbi:putative nuclease HARBI1 [Venturia canescens]|uniref:putative nuclease HARBI1 n=1 Tax=Venturia canescens TaxID=32260 RepID=UPI001C9CC6E4|nr:putative nuclease HARBI1 [Venturia canescens]
MIHEVIEVSSSESDDAEQIIVQRLKKRRKVCRVENYVEQVVPGLTTQEFKAHFRMLPDTFQYILSIIAPKLQRETRGTPMICPQKQFLLALWRFATPGSFRSISDRFDLAPLVIKWPTGEEVEEVWAGFEASSGFPKVIGAIDGTHIRIPAPKVNPEAYVNRKGHHSIQLQAICDHKGQYTHCYVGHVGSVHDQRVFRLSEVPSYFGNLLKFPQQCHLVGDSAYKLHENLLTPYRDNGHLTERQRNYNFSQSSARIAIERAFGLLKGRFRSLLTVLAVDRVIKIPKHVLACCVLHNICLTRDNDLNIEVEEEEIMDCEMADDNERVRNAVNTGSIKRDTIAGQLHIRNV